MDRYERARRTVDSIATENPAFEMDVVRELLDHNELVVGLEILCDNLYEYDVPMSEAARQALVHICRKSGLAAHYWQRFQAS